MSTLFIIQQGYQVRTCSELMFQSVYAHVKLVNKVNNVIQLSSGITQGLWHLEL